MPKGNKKKDAPMPMQGAGLIRFFEDETHGIKIKPTYVIIASVLLIGVVVLAHVVAGM
jgi:preprotein translocase subunit Sec61beta